MSPFKPRADKFGGLPHLSYIKRKPMPFGTEFKTRYLVRRRFVEAKVQNTTDLLVPIEIALYDI